MLATQKQHTYSFDFFLSFAGENRSLAEEAWRQLRMNGFQVFFDRFSIALGEDIDRGLPKAIRHSVVFVAFVTKFFLEKLDSAPGREFRCADTARKAGLVAYCWTSFIAVDVQKACLAVKLAYEPDSLLYLPDLSALIDSLTTLRRQTPIRLNALERDRSFSIERFQKQNTVHVLSSEHVEMSLEIIRSYFQGLGWHVTISNDSTDYNEEKGKDARKDIRCAKSVFVILSDACVGNQNFQRYVDYAAAHAKCVVPVFDSSISEARANRVPLFSWNNGIGGRRGFDFRNEKERVEFGQVMTQVLQGRRDGADIGSGLLLPFRSI